MSPRTKQQNEQIRDERRNELIAAALKVFACKGYAATKITDISAEAGLSHGLIHYYFASKEDIFTEVVRDTIEKSSHAMDRLMAMPGSAADLLREATNRNLHQIDAEENAWRWLVMMQVAISDAVPAETKKMLSTSFESLRKVAEIIARGQEKNEIVEGDPMKLATGYWAMMQGLILFRYYNTPSLSLPDADMVMRLLR